MHIFANKEKHNGMYTLYRHEIKAKMKDKNTPQKITYLNNTFCVTQYKYRVTLKTILSKTISPVTTYTICKGLVERLLSYACPLVIVTNSN